MSGAVSMAASGVVVCWVGVQVDVRADVPFSAIFRGCEVRVVFPGFRHDFGQAECDGANWGRSVAVPS